MFKNGNFKKIHLMNFQLIFFATMELVSGTGVQIESKMNNPRKPNVFKTTLIFLKCPFRKVRLSFHIRKIIWRDQL